MPPSLTRSRSKGPTLGALVLFVALGDVAHAAVKLDVQPVRAKPGDLVLLRVRGAKELPEGTVGDQKLEFYKAGASFEALAALPVELPPQQLDVRVKARRPGGEERELKTVIDIIDAKFARKELSVDQKFIEPPDDVKKRAEEDRQAFAEAFKQPLGERLFTKNFIWPRKAKITAPFGDLRMFNEKQKSQHYGVDLDGRTGAPIHAPNDGVVVLVRDAYYSGKTVVLHHGGGLFTTYFHLSKILVEKGDKVRHGQKLGLVGATGRVTGPHLHWGVKVGGRYVNGESLVSLDFSWRQKGRPR